MADKIPFSQEELNEIFKISLRNPDLVVSRESSSLEFKESFGWLSLSKYLRTCAAYANARGGYIVFGIANRPHRLVGLSGTNLQLFENIDPEKMSRNLNDHFAPEIHWSIHEHELNGTVFGLLYVYEASDKPVVCKKDADKDLKEGDIYYRYRGRSERIKYPELRAILENKREQEQKLWMQHLRNIARIGVREAGIFDLQSGQVDGVSGAFLIDESLLARLAFIKEGEFSEIKGKPALKLIGDLEPIKSMPSTSGRKQIVKTKGIRITDIVETFLTGESVPEPQEYIAQICFESTGFLPVYYFMNVANLSTDKTVEFLDSVVSRLVSKAKLIERLQGDATQQLPLTTVDTPAGRKKREFAQQLLDGSVDESLSGDDLKYCLQAIRGLSAEDVKTHSKSLCELLRLWFHQHYASANGTLADNLRRATCWVDEALYMETAK